MPGRVAGKVAFITGAARGQGRSQGGSIVLTSSTAGITGIGGDTPGGLGYTAAKHGVVGLMRSYANYR